MQLIKDHASSALLNLLDSVKAKPKGYVGAYLSLSIKQDVAVKEVLAQLEQVAAKVFNKKNVQLFCYEDQHLFILTHELTLPTLKVTAAEILDGLSAFLTLRPSIHIYDLEKEWTPFARLAVDKQQAEQKATAKPAAKPVNFMEQMKQIVQRLGPNAFKAALEKRAKRKDKLILLVEDEAFSRTLVQRALEKECQLMAVGDSRAAMEKYFLHAPDLVFLDINLPDVKGDEMLRYIKQLDPDSTVVMLSADKTEGMIKKAMQAGAKGYVVKPFNKEKLLVHVRALGKK